MRFKKLVLLSLLLVFLIFVVPSYGNGKGKDDRGDDDCKDKKEMAARGAPQVHHRRGGHDKPDKPCPEPPTPPAPEPPPPVTPPPPTVPPPVEEPPKPQPAPEQEPEPKRPVCFFPEPDRMTALVGEQPEFNIIGIADDGTPTVAENVRGYVDYSTAPNARVTCSDTKCRVTSKGAGTVLVKVESQYGGEKRVWVIFIPEPNQPYSDTLLLWPASDQYGAGETAAMRLNFSTRYMSGGQLQLEVFAPQCGSGQNLFKSWRKDFVGILQGSGGVQTTLNIGQETLPGGYFVRGKLLGLGGNIMASGYGYLPVKSAAYAPLVKASVGPDGIRLALSQELSEMTTLGTNFFVALLYGNEKFFLPLATIQNGGELATTVQGYGIRLPPGRYTVGLISVSSNGLRQVYTQANAVVVSEAMAVLVID